ncbi:hypothetical protein O1V64_10840 [Rouxiella badensis]|nr:hypothetical protein O1V64_10840 [Rouxiella badensis]
MSQLNLSPDLLASLVNVITPFNEQQFIDKLYGDIDFIMTDLERSSNKYYCDDEDKITNLIALSLRMKGYDATEQTNSNGTVDLTIKDGQNRFTWLAEAKRGYSLNSVFEGLLQLITRYIKREQHAGLLIYHQKSGAMTFLKDWYTYLSSGNYQKYEKIKDRIEECDKCFKLSPVEYSIGPDDNSNFFDFTAVKPNDGTVKVRCFIADLHFNPMDKSAGTNASLAKGQCKISITDICTQWDSDGKPPIDVNVLLQNLKDLHPEYFA